MDGLHYRTLLYLTIIPSKEDISITLNKLDSIYILVLVLKIFNFYKVENIDLIPALLDAVLRDTKTSLWC